MLRKTLYLLTLGLCLTNYCYAEDFIHIKPNIEKETPVIKNDPVNIINIYQGGTIVKEKPEQWSEEAKKVYSELQKIDTNQKNMNFYIALEQVNELLKEYPDNSILMKWKGIYENRNLLYEQSNDTFDNLLKTFPEDKTLHNGLDIKFFQADNFYHQKEYNKAKDIVASALAKKFNVTTNPQKNTFASLQENNGEVFRTAFLFLDLMIDKDITGNINEVKMNEVWQRFSPNQYPHLANYYAMDLSDLLYEYGMFYNRKDVLKIYVDRKEKASDKETIKKVQLAKYKIFKSL